MSNYIFILCVCVQFLEAIAFKNAGIIRSRQNQHSAKKLNAVLFLADPSGVLNGEDCGKCKKNARDTGWDYGFPGVDMVQSACIEQCIPDTESTVGDTFESLLRYGRDSCNCEELLNKSLTSLIDFCRDKLGMTIAIVKVTNNSFSTDIRFQHVEKDSGGEGQPPYAQAEIEAGIVNPVNRQPIDTNRATVNEPPAMNVANPMMNQNPAPSKPIQMDQSNEIPPQQQNSESDDTQCRIDNETGQQQQQKQQQQQQQQQQQLAQQQGQQQEQQKPMNQTQEQSESESSVEHKNNSQQQNQSNANQTEGDECQPNEPVNQMNQESRLNQTQSDTTQPQSSENQINLGGDMCQQKSTDQSSQQSSQGGPAAGQQTAQQPTQQFGQQSGQQFDLQCQQSNQLNQSNQSTQSNQTNQSSQQCQYAKDAEEKTKSMGLIARKNVSTRAKHLSKLQVNKHTPQLRRISPEKDNVPLYEVFSPQRKYKYNTFNRWHKSTDDGEVEPIIGPEHTEIFKLRIKRLDRARHPAREDVPAYNKEPRPKSLMDMINLMEKFKQTIFNSLVGGMVVEEERGANMNDLCEKSGSPSLFDTVKRTFSKVTNCNKSGYLMVVYGGNLTDKCNMDSSLMQSVKYVIDNTNQEDTVVVLTGHCPSGNCPTGLGSNVNNGSSIVAMGEGVGGHPGKGSNNLIPVYARGPINNMFNDAKELYDVPAIIKKTLEEQNPQNSENCDGGGGDNSRKVGPEGHSRSRRHLKKRVKRKAAHVASHNKKGQANSANILKIFLYYTTVIVLFVTCL